MMPDRCTCTYTLQNPISAPVATVALRYVGYSAGVLSYLSFDDASCTKCCCSPELGVIAVPAGVILLAGLFVYDIFWVFCTPVMVSVAKSFDAPIKLLFKRAGDTGPRPFRCLGAYIQMPHSPSWAITGFAVPIVYFILRHWCVCLCTYCAVHVNRGILLTCVHVPAACWG
jgi:Signal peptide peptidase